MKKDIELLYGLFYETVRKDCHAIKNCEFKAIEDWARILAQEIPDGSVLVPVPGHKGRARSTYFLAQAIRQKAFPGKNLLVYDCLKSKRHTSLCELKQKGLPTEGVELGVRFTNFFAKIAFQSVRIGRTVILIDNVIDTGKTVRACMEVLEGDVKTAVVGDTGAWREQK